MMVMGIVRQYDTHVEPPPPPQPPMRPMREPDVSAGREDGGGSLAFPPPSVRGLFGLSSDIFYALLRCVEKGCEGAVKGSIKGVQDLCKHHNRL